ncbi:MAG: hypothetical protein IKT38_02265 [Clostridia bacterium]|nr:hypothetical protein [Clostridia bacterium]
MAENSEIITPENENKMEAVEDTTPNTDTIRVKFNKEFKEIPLEDATTLIQKGMKYDLIYKDYETLKNLSAQNDKSVEEFLSDINGKILEKRIAELTEKCSGDREFAQKVAELECGKEVSALRGFNELQEIFPEIKKETDLPEEVIEKAELSGRALTDEYLRYLLFKERALKQANKNKKLTENVCIGSQINRDGRDNPEAVEFLKGLWK